MSPSISFTVMNVLSDEALRLVQHELVTHVEQLRADDIRPSRGQADCIRQINDELAKREARR